MKKIMVVDDEPDLIYTVKDALKAEYEVIGANSGKQCLELLNKKQIPDLIILDIMMPEMSGWETYSRLKAKNIWKDIPVIFLTARTDMMARTAGGFFGDDYIEKPFNRKEFKLRIDKILE